MKLSVMATVWDRDQRQGPRNYPLVKPLGKDTRCNPPVNLVQGIATSWHNSWYCYPHRPPAGMTVPCPNIFNINTWIYSWWVFLLRLELWMEMVNGKSSYIICTLKCKLRCDSVVTIDWYMLHFAGLWINAYRLASNISSIIVGNIIVDHSDVVGASPVGAAPNIFSFSA